MFFRNWQKDVAFACYPICKIEGVAVRRRVVELHWCCQLIRRTRPCRSCYRQGLSREGKLIHCRRHRFAMQIGTNGRALTLHQRQNGRIHKTLVWWFLSKIWEKFLRLFLWNPNATLPINCTSASQLFKKMLTRLESDPNKLELYQNTISCDLDKRPRQFLVTSIQNSTIKFIRQDEFYPNTVSSTPTSPENSPCPQRKIQIQKCLTQWPSSSGPDLLSNLLAVSCWFRERKNPFNADIEGLYIQVFIQQEDRIFLRFLWGTTKQKFYEYARFVFGAK